MNSGLGSEWGKYGYCRICGLPNGTCKHIRKDTRGSMGLCVNSWWLRDNTCACHRTSLYCTYGTRHGTK
ncbi:unnamed protein product [Staurois parvus]|uniref:Uncharacterized protein n=1 Tax=Staurois parvus TaxID=386267 RepID=A0ABN9CXG7_9NEOB|nr:unnamed protein product [Staurois parvus]